MSTSPITRYDPTHPAVTSVPMRLNSDRVRRWKFDAASFGRRGLAPDNVERFRLQVADELDMLQKQLADAHSDVQRLSSQLELRRYGVLPSLSDSVEAPSAREVDLLSAAQREAEQIVAQAHDYARRVAEYARQQYDSFMRQATAQARKEAERIVDEHRHSAGAAFNDTAAKQEVIRVVGELMLSHLQAAARQLDSGAAQIARAMQAIPPRPPNPADGKAVDRPGPR